MLTALVAATVLSATYYSAECNFSFDYPSSWSVAEKPRCSVELRPPWWRQAMRESIFDLNPYPVRVMKVNRGLVEAATKSFFVYTGETKKYWGIPSRGPTLPAEHFRTACCRGMRGTSWSRIWSRDHEVGTHVWEGAVVNDRKGHSIIIESDSADEFADVVTEIIESVRFGPPVSSRQPPADHSCTHQGFGGVGWSSSTPTRSSR